MARHGGAPAGTETEVVAWPIAPEGSESNAPGAPAGPGARRLPPLVRGLPFLGNALELRRDPLPVFVKAYEELGPVFRVRAPGREYTVIAGPEATQFLAQGGEEYLSSREVFHRAMRELRTENFIAALDGEPHRHQRSILRAGLSREAVAGYIPRMIGAVERIAATWRPGQRVRVKPTMQFLVSEQLGEGMAHHALGERFHDAVLFAETLVGAGVAGTWPTRRLRTLAYWGAKRRVVRVMRDLVRARRALGANERSEREPDLLDVLLAARDMDGRPLTEIDLIVGAQLPYIAGMDTVASTCGFLLYSLLKHPAILERVTAEVDAAFAGGAPDVAAFGRMRALHGAAMETFRLYPVVSAAPRYAKRPFSFAGYSIDPRHQILLSTTTAHFLPRFFRDPYTFDIDRYEEPRFEHRQPGAFAPFAAGPHTCVAAGVAEATVMVTLATLLHTTRFELDPPGYTLRTTIDPLPGPEARFRVRVAPRR